MKVAFLGLGIMGSRMAANLARAGHRLTVWNRTAERAETFAAAHAADVAPSPAAAAREAEVVISMVVDGAQVESVLLGRDGAAVGAAPGTLFVDCSTIGPTAARRIGAALREAGHTMLDAPVTGSSPRAQDGTLTFMVGGELEDFRRAEPLLEAMGRLIVHAGALGHGQSVKLINNALAAVNATTVAQALVVARREEIDLDALVQVVGAGSGASAMLELKAGPMRAHDYTTLFKLDHMLKDVRLCLEEAEAAGAPFPLAALTRETLATASGFGFGEQDFAALLEAVEAAARTRL